MIRSIFLILLGTLLPALASPLELNFKEDMTLSDFYSQGIYPSHGGRDGISFLIRDLVISVGDQKNVFSMEEGFGTFTFTVQNEMHHGMINVADYTTVEEGTQIMLAIAEQLGATPQYGNSHPDTPTSAAGASWTSMGVRYTIPNTEWTLSFLAKRSEEMVFLHLFFHKPTTRGEDFAFVREWKTKDLLEAPEEWSHLPLRKKHNSINKEVTDFLHRVSSYDSEGNLLPKFEARRSEVANRQKPTRRHRSKESISIEPASQEPTYHRVALAALIFISTVIGYFFYQRCRRERRGRGES